MSENLKYTCLFGGGAVRGMAYIGAIRAMEELGIEYDIVAGSSVGSIFAALLACGYDSYELEKVFLKVNFEIFKDIHFGFGKPFAISKGEVFTDWLNGLIAKKFNNPDARICFKDLEKELVIVTTNLHEFKSQEFSNKVTPDFEVAKAIRISSSMPGLMPPYEYNGASLVDGDLMKAAPMWTLSNTLENSQSRILEFRLEGDCGLNGKNPLAFVNTIYSCITEAATDFITDVYGGNDRYECLKINTGDIVLIDFTIDKESRKKLLEIGYNQTMEYFKNCLPLKKSKLERVYSDILKYLKEIYKGVKINNVEEVQFWLGDLYITLCENKEIIDPQIYSKISSVKDKMMDSVSRLLFFHSKFKRQEAILDELKSLLDFLDGRLGEIRLYLETTGEAKTLLK